MNPKKFLLLLAAITVLPLISAPKSFANDDSATVYQWHDKFGRGFTNAVTAPLEIIRGIDLTSKSDGPAKGWTIGAVKGLTGGILRFGAGMVDLLTFPFKWPDENNGPIIEPAYVWEDWQGEYMKKIP